MPFFSIIVPVYNASHYLPRCIESITHQEFDDYELILVDDGSADESLQICNTYVKNSDHVVVLHQNNSGAGFARNLGLTVAKGKWILFVDSDDYIEPCLAELKSKIQSIPKEQLFLCRWRGIHLSDDGSVIKKYEIGPKKEKKHQFCSLEETLDNFNNNYYGYSVWKMVISSEFIRVNNFSFKSGGYGEDFYWCMELFSVIHSFYSLDILLYDYQYKQSGTQMEMSGRNILNFLSNLSQLLDKASFERDNETRTVFVRLLASEYYKYLCRAVDYNIKAEWVAQLKENRENIRFAKQKAARAMYALSGVSLNLVWILWRLRHKFKKETPVD